MYFTNINDVYRRLLRAYLEYPVAEERSIGAQRRCARTSMIRFHPPYRDTIIRIGSWSCSPADFIHTRMMRLRTCVVWQRVPVSGSHYPLCLPEHPPLPTHERASSVSGEGGLLSSTPSTHQVRAAERCNAALPPFNYRLRAAEPHSVTHLPFLSPRG